jgi:thioesterase domain-containing protein/acyl carrier protein
MIPSVFVMMDELPLTATGKVDRLALPEPDATRPELGVNFVAPRDELETKLAKIWEEIIGIDSIGVRDDFFDLGGHSLVAAQLFHQIQKMFGRELPLIALLHAPTVGQLADILRQEEWSPPWSSLVEFQSGGSKPPFFCVHACNGEVFFYADLARHLGREQPFYGLRAQGLDGQQAPHTSIEDMAAHYIKEMQIVQPEAPYFIGGGGVGGRIAFEMAQQLLALDQKVGLLVLIDAAAPIPASLNSRKSLGHYFRRSIHHLRHRQLTIILRNIVRNQRRRVTRRFKPRHTQLVRNALEMARRSYIPKVYPGRIIYFLSGKREKAPGGVQAAIGDWYDLAADGLNVFHIPGDHLKILEEPHVRVVAEHLRTCLGEVQRDAAEVGYVEARSAGRA